MSTDALARAERAADKAAAQARRARADHEQAMSAARARNDERKADYWADAEQVAKRERTRLSAARFAVVDAVAACDADKLMQAYLTYARTHAEVERLVNVASAATDTHEQYDPETGRGCGATIHRVQPFGVHRVASFDALVTEGVNKSEQTWGRTYASEYTRPLRESLEDDGS